ncbi:MAG: transposase [Pirellulales bacterium]
MNEPLRDRIQVFDPKQDYAIVERRLPHWSQSGTLAFITWRTWDSIPANVLAEWLALRNAWLRRHGIDPEGANWRTALNKLDVHQALEFRLMISDRWNDHLDACHGECVLRRPELAGEVASSLTHFDQERYDLTDFVVMPNHVHLLVAFPDEQSMLNQCESWKHYTAVKTNRALGRNGRFWQQDGFDHLVRTVQQFEYYRQYIADNPRRARLGEGEYIHLSKQI